MQTLTSFDPRELDQLENRDIRNLALLEADNWDDELAQLVRAGDPTLMAEIAPDEGLDLLLGIFPKNGTNLATTYLSLFTAFTASTVGASSGTMSGYTEADFAGFLVQSIASTDWGSAAAGTGGRKVVASQKSFPAATGVGSGLAINGYSLRNQSTFAGAKCLGAANFDEGQVPALAIGDIVRVTPTWQNNN